MLSNHPKTRILIAVFGALGVLALLVAELVFGAIRSAPRVDRSAFIDDANLVMVVQPEKAPKFMESIAREATGYTIPSWLLQRSMPHELGIAFTENESNSEIHVSAYGSMQRFAKSVLFLDHAKHLDSTIDEIQWNPTSIEQPQRGILQASGIVQPDLDALDQVYLQWGESSLLVPKTVSGDHFWELLFDNRAGKAYLSMASMMTAFDYKFSEKNMEIMLSSIQFVTEARAYADISENDILEITIDMDIVPSARNRIGVLNLKGAIDEGFAEFNRRMEDEGSDIRIEGSSDWNEMTIEFRYTVNKATPFALKYWLDEK